MGIFIRLVEYCSAGTKEEVFLQAKNIYQINQTEFKKIPGSLFAYWISNKLFSIFKDKYIRDIWISDGQTKTGNNEKYLRFVWEVEEKKIGKGEKWLFYYKGGYFKRWFGNIEEVIDWSISARQFYRKDPIARILPEYLWYKSGVSWGLVSTNAPSFRYLIKEAVFDVGGTSIFFKKDEELLTILGLLNSKIAKLLLPVFNPTMNYQLRDIGSIPILPTLISNKSLSKSIARCITIAKSDWDIVETSWDFLRSPLVTNYSLSQIETIIDENLTDWSWPSAYQVGRAINLAEQEKSYKNHWTKLFLELHRNEEENNRIFIELYGLQDELTPEVPYSEITILQEELVESARKEGHIEFDEFVLARQFVSYGVGCLMGRYSVEKDGLILADAGASLDDFKAKVPDATFLPDVDGILPLTDEDDFLDDLPTRFKAWLRFISGSCYEDNLRWIEERLGRDLRSYFVRDFYKDHLRRYKNRPIYWMVTSPSGAFRALLYLHRYTKDSVGKVLNDYLRPYRTKLDQKLRGLRSTLDSPSSSQSEKTSARKRIAQLEKIQNELELWEKDALYPTALKRIELDLDNGVKVNYRKLGGILEPVKQLEAKDQD